MAESFVGSNRVVLLARSLSKAGIPILEFVDGSCSKRRVVRSYHDETKVRFGIEGGVWCCGSTMNGGVMRLDLTTRTAIFLSMQCIPSFSRNKEQAV